MITSTYGPHVLRRINDVISSWETQRTIVIVMTNTSDLVNEGYMINITDIH